MKKSSKSNHSNLSSVGYRRQMGGTIWGLLFNCGILLFAAYIGMKLVPVYTNESAIQDALTNSVAEFAQGSQVQSRKLMKSMDKRLYIDGISTAGLYDRMVIEKSKNETTVTMPYDRKIPLFSNISLFLDFEATATK